MKAASCLICLILILSARADNFGADPNGLHRNVDSLFDGNAVPQTSVDSKAVLIAGAVLQKLSGGILVTCSPGHGGPAYGSHSMGGGGNTSASNGGPPRVYGTFYLVKVPGEKDLVDNDHIEIVAYPNGQFKYEDTKGVMKTVRQYSAQVPSGTSP